MTYSTTVSGSANSTPAMPKISPQATREKSSRAGGSSTARFWKIA
jgi:hypothetical protein